LAQQAHSTRSVGYRALFRNRDYRLLFSGLVISLTGSWAYNVALVVYVFGATHSTGWVAAAWMTRYLTALVASPFGGLIADRVERVRLMVGLDVLAFGFQVLLAVVAALNAPVVLALVLAALTSVTTSTYDPAARSATPSVVGEDHLATANSAQAAVEQLAIIMGPAVGVVLLLLGPPPVVFAVNAATFALSALVVSRMRTRNQPADITEGGTAGPLQQMATGFKAFVSSPTIVLLAGFSILATFVAGTDTVLYVVVSKDLLGTGSSGFGYLLAAVGLGGILASVLVNRIAAVPRLGAIIVAGMCVYCLPTALLTLVPSPVIAALIQVVRGAGTLVVDVLAITALQRLVSPQIIARVFGVFFALVLAAVSLGALAAPLLLNSVGLTATLLIMGFVVPAISLVAYPWIRALDTRAQGELATIRPRVAVLQGLDIFAGATQTALERLARSLIDETVAPGTVIISEGEEADDFFVLVDGQVEVFSAGEADAERSLGVLQAPDYFGEIGLLERRPRTATVKTVTESTLYRISGVDFIDALTAAPPTPAALTGVQGRLARTHPSLTMGFGQAAD